MAEITEWVKKVWKNRITEFPTRRTLTKEDGSSEIVTVTRNEGTVSEEGDAFDADTMNNLEERIDAGFADVTRKLEAKIGYMDSQNGTKIINNNGSYIIQSNGYIRTYFDTSPGAVRVNNVTYIYFGSSIIMTFPPIPVKAGDIITAVGFNSNQSSISFVPEASSE